MSTPQPKDLLFRAGGLTLERYGVPVWRRAPISRGGEEWKETFTRADGGTPVCALLGRDGLYHLVQQNALRVEYVPNVDVGDGLGPRTRATLLLEGSRINRLPQPLNFGAWALAGGAPAAVGGQADPFGGTGAWLLTDNSGAIAQNYSVVAAGLTSDGTKGMAIFLKQGTAAVTTVQVFDLTAALNRIAINVTWNGSAAPTLTIAQGVGQVWTPTPVPGAPGWWRIPFNGQGLVAANGNNFIVLPAGLVAASQGTVLAYCAQLEDGVFPSSPLPTTIFRQSDLLQVPIGWGGRDLTVLARFIRPLWADATVNLGAESPGVFDLGDAATNKVWSSSSAAARIWHWNVESGGASADAPPAIPAGAILDLTVRLKNSQTLAPFVELELSTGTLVGGAGTTQALKVFANPRMRVGGQSNGSNSIWANLLDLIVADGAFSRADMLALP